MSTEGATAWRQERRLEQEQKAKQLQDALESASTPEDRSAAAQAIYGPSVFKQHAENLFGRLIGRTPQPIVNPAAAATPAVTTMQGGITPQSDSGDTINLPALPAYRDQNVLAANGGGRGGVQQPGVTASTVQGLSTAGQPAPTKAAPGIGDDSQLPALPAPMPNGGIGARPVTVTGPIPQNRAQALAGILSRGAATPEQQKTRDNIAAYNQYIGAGFSPQQAGEMVGIRNIFPKLVTLQNPDGTQKQTLDSRDPELRSLLSSGWTQVTPASGNLRSLGIGISPQAAVNAMNSMGEKYRKPGGGFYTSGELSTLPVNSQLRPYSMGGQVVYGIANQAEHSVTFGNQVYKMDQFGDIDTDNPLGPSRVPTQHTSVTVDPFGVSSTTSSTTTPVSSAPATTASGKATPAPAAPIVIPNAGIPAPRKTATGGQSKSSTGNAPPIPAGAKQLDANGHIPEGAANPQLAQAANAILDGMDVDKLPLPPRDRTAAMALAQQYGYKGQGLFTPREALQLREGATVIQNMLESPALKVLDQGTIANLPMLGQSADPSKAGIWGRLSTAIASKSASPDQQEFLRYWRQLDALAIGLRGLVQTGRATQAQVERLIAELPNPYNTTSSADAKNRLRLVQNELRVAAESGKLTDVPLGQKSEPKVLKYNRSTKKLE